MVKIKPFEVEQVLQPSTLYQAALLIVLSGWTSMKSHLKDGRYWRKGTSGQIVPLYARLGAVVFGLEVDQGQEWILKRVARRP